MSHSPADPNHPHEMETGPARAAVAPAWSTLALTWVNNLGATVCLIAVYFIARQEYAFTPRQSLMLGLLQGVTYIAGSLTVGPFTSRFVGPGRLIHLRTLLWLLMLAMAALSVLPWMWPSPSSIWLLVGLYSPVSGWLWPTIESFLSAGHPPERLRSMTGAFNFSWASCQVITFWAISGPLEHHALVMLPLFGLSHLIALPLVAVFPRDPSTYHADLSAGLTDSERDRSRRLLSAFRLLNVLSYMIYSTVNPLLPAQTASLGFVGGWGSALASVWMTSRVITFGVMQRWHGWHGRRTTIAWAAGFLITGFVLTMTAPHWAFLAAGLALFGIGMGTIYSAAFYYAMEVGSAGVDAGGKHEALIGAGYTAGPLLSLGAADLLRRGAFADGTTIATASLAVVGVVALAALWRVARVAAPSK